MFEGWIRDWLAGQDVALSRALTWLLGQNVRADREIRSDAWRLANLTWHALRDRTVPSLSRAVRAWRKLKQELHIRGKLDLLFQHLPRDWRDLEEDLLETDWWYPVVRTPGGFTPSAVVTTAVGPRFSSAAQAHAWWQAEPEPVEEGIKTRAERYRFSASRPCAARWDLAIGDFVDHQVV